MRECCERLRYVSVRNRTTLTFVRRCGFAGPVHLVPDPAFALEVPAATDASVDELVARLAIDPDRITVGISIGPSLHEPRTAAFFDPLFATLSRLGRDLPLQFVVFPFSHLQHDDTVVDGVAARLPGAMVVRERIAPLVLWRLIGRLHAYLGCRYHAMIAAIAQDVPFLVLDEYLADAVASSKTAS